MKQIVKPRNPDLFLFIPILILVGIGMVMVYSASGVRSTELYRADDVIFFKQFVALCAGLVGMGIAVFFPHHIYRNRVLLLAGILGILGLLIAVKFQTNANGANRWFYIGRFGFQPSDLAKLVLVVFTAAFATAKFDGPDYLQWRKRLIFIAPVVGTICALILLQPDFGTTMFILFIVGVMLFVSGLPWKWIAVGSLLMLPIAVGLMFTKSYRTQRIMSFLHEEHYQNRQAKIALGVGGLTGVGLGKGKQKLYYLPEPHTDFIYATLGEELGFMGTATVLICYLFFFFRGAYVLFRIDDPYSKVLGTGILVLITVQALMNISITLALFPNKGITLPFMSAGGTSLILSLVMCGVLLNISRSRIVENRVVEA